MTNKKEELIEYMIENIQVLEDLLKRIKLDYDHPLGIDIEQRDEEMLDTMYKKTVEVIRED